MNDRLSRRTGTGTDPTTAWWAADFLRIVPGAAEATARGSVSVASEEATALVEGRRFLRRRVRFLTPALTPRFWKAFCEVFAARALYPAALGAGYLPRAARSELARVGVRLVPSPSRVRIEPADAAPDVLAAGCRLVAARFAEDPLLLLRFRGADPAAVMAETARPWRASGPQNGNAPLLPLDDLRAILDRPPAPDEAGSLLPSVRTAEVFRTDPVLRGSLVRLYTKVAERAAAVGARPPRAEARPPTEPPSDEDDVASAAPDQYSGGARRSAARIASRRPR